MIVYMCNALDEETRDFRVITTDSPAATKKVFGLCYAIQIAGGNASVLSMGRGRQNGSYKKFSAIEKKVGSAEVFYASFWHVPLLTHLVTVFSLVLCMWSILKKKSVKVLLYNRQWHYVPATLLAKLYGAACYLDLEDGWVADVTVSQRILTSFYNWACDSGSLLACDALKEQVKTVHNLPCYGVASVITDIDRDWNSEKLQVLFGGSLWEGTGAGLFIDAIDLLIASCPNISNFLNIVVVGFGEKSQDIERLALNSGGLVDFRGMVSNSEYQSLLDSSHAGMCLKLSSGEFQDSTFPSKVIEITANGLLLVSTKVSDVPVIFNEETSLLLERDEPEVLMNALIWFANHRDEVKIRALAGKDMILQKFSEKRVGQQLLSFFKEL